MPLRRSKSTPSPAPKPTLEQRVATGAQKKDQATTLLSVAVNGLTAASDELSIVAQDAAAEAARLADISAEAQQHAAEARGRADEITGLL